MREGVTKKENYKPRERLILHRFAGTSKSVKTRPRYGDLSIFQDGSRRYLGFLKFQIFNGRNGQEVGTASACQISSKSLEKRTRYGNFAIFQYGSRRHLGFLKFQIFNGLYGQEGQTACPSQISSKSLEPRPRYNDFSIFPRWRPSAILDL